MWTKLLISALSDPLSSSHGSLRTWHGLVADAYFLQDYFVPGHSGHNHTWSFPNGWAYVNFFWLNNLMKFYRWADMNVSRPIPKSPGVQCGGGLGYLLTYIENLILGFLFPIFFTFVVYVCWRCFYIASDALLDQLFQVFDSPVPGCVSWVLTVLWLKSDLSMSFLLEGGDWGHVHRCYS